MSVNHILALLAAAALATMPSVWSAPAGGDNKAFFEKAVDALQTTFESFRHKRLAMLEPRVEDCLVARRWIETDNAPGLRVAAALHLALVHRQGLCQLA